MKKFGLVFISVFFMTLLGVAANGASEVKIGYVDLQKALNESQSGKDAKAKFTEEVKKRQDELSSKEEELKKMKDELEKKAMILKKEAVKEKAEELRRKGEEFQRFYLQSEEEIKRKEALLTRDIIISLEKIVKELAKEEGYSFIFERSEGGIIYGPETNDLTNEVIKRYDNLQKENK